jgi:hypothetical protein
MKTRNLIALLFITMMLNASSLYAQTEFHVPENYVLKVAADYANYESDLVAASKWMEATDLDKEIDKRARVNKFMFDWTYGCPFSIMMPLELGNIYGKNNELLIIYMAGYARYYIENKATATEFAEKKAGLISIMNVYKKGIDIKRSKEMEKVIKADNDNTLDVYIKEKFN